MRLEMGGHGVVPSRLMWLYAGVAIRGDKLRLLRALDSVASRELRACTIIWIIRRFSI